MCYKGKCFYCIPVEYGCLVFAFLSAIFTLIALQRCGITGLLALFVVPKDIRQIYVYTGEKSSYGSHLSGGVDISVVSLIASLLSLITFIFSVLLCNGLCKRRPGQVKAYFIYGVVITVLAVDAAFIAMVFSDVPQLGLAGLVGCVIYSLILWMVFETYAKLSAGGAVFKDHIPQTNIA